MLLSEKEKKAPKSNGKEQRHQPLMPRAHSQWKLKPGFRREMLIHIPYWDLRPSFE